MATYTLNGWNLERLWAQRGVSSCRPKYTTLSLSCYLPGKGLFAHPWSIKRLCPTRTGKHERKWPDHIASLKHLLSKTLAIAVRKRRSRYLQSDSIYMFEYVYIFSNVLQNHSWPKLQRTACLKGELLWKQNKTVVRKSDVDKVWANLWLVSRLIMFHQTVS